MWNKYQLTQTELMKKLERPEKPVDVVLDTDTYNEIDDQFALAYLIKLKDKLNLKQIYAAPFYNHRSDSPKDGMTRSYNEIHKILDFMNEESLKKNTYFGSDKYLSDEETPVKSDAAEKLVELAMTYSEEDPLYVIGLAALTNISSAILLNPEIIRRIVVVWLGGNAFEWIDNKEFNALQDVAAVRVLLDSGVPVVILPCMGVVSNFRTTQPELERWLSGKNAISDYLVKSTVDEAEKIEQSSSWSRVIWDVTPIGWLLGSEFTFDRLEHSPVAQYDHRWSFDKRRHLIKYVYHVDRDLLFEDMFEKLSK